MKKIPSIVIGSGFGERVIAKILKKNKKFILLNIVTRKNINKIDFKKAKIVFLATPPHSHLWWIRKIPNGPKIVCEKPLANNLRNSKKILSYKKNIICINHQLRFSKILNFLRKKNKTDKITSLYINHETNHSIKEKRLQGWWSSRSLGGGQIFALGSHFIDIVTFVFGKIKSVKCNLKVLRSKRQNISDDYFEIKIKTKSNCQINIKSNSFTKKKEKLNMYIKTQKKKYYKSNKLKNIMDDSKTISSEVSIKDNFIKKNLWRVCLSKFLNELHKSFYKKKSGIYCTLEQAFYNQKIIDYCLKSNQQNKEIRVK